MKFSVKPIVKIAKKNWKHVPTIIGVAKAVNDYDKKRKEDKSKYGKLPYRKERYQYYKTEVLKSLDKKIEEKYFNIG